MPKSSQRPILIDNIQLLTNRPDRISAISTELGAILVSGSRIQAVCQNAAEIAALHQHAAEIIDGDGKIAMPGLINAHCHTYASVLRGTENSQPLEVWALYTMAYGRSLDPSLMDTAVKLSAAEMIRNGVTAVIDHIPHIGLFQHTMAAHAETEMRVGLAPFMQDIPDHVFLGIPLPDELRLPLETPPPMTPAETRSFFDEFFARAQDLPDRIIPIIGPNGPQRCSPELWQVWRELQETHDAPVHTHLLETKAQALKSRQLWDGGLVAEMQRQGLLNSKLTAAHGIWLLDSERQLLADFDVTVVHNPTSNLMLGSGVIPYGEYAERGVAIAIGSDSTNTGGRHDLFECIRLAAMLPRLSQPDYETWPSAADVMVNSIRAGAGALGLGGELGQLVPGQFADLILLDMNKATAIGPATTLELVAQHAAPGVVTDVMTDGNWLLRDRELQTFDETSLIATFADQREGLLARTNSQSNLLEPTAQLIKEYLTSLPSVCC